MELSFLYHGFGIDSSYHYHATEYKDKSIILTQLAHYRRQSFNLCYRIPLF